MRIVGGKLRGSKLKYAGDPRVRPMKDRIREALFNLLGPEVKGTFALDLFGGTGALALEAMSRGATGGLIIERHHPTARVIQENIEMLGLEAVVHLVRANTFHWFRTEPELPLGPWVVFISPPYRLFTEQRDDLLTLIRGLVDRAPSGSLFAVEATDEFDFQQLPEADRWDIRRYAPATVAVLKITPVLRQAVLDSSTPDPRTDE